MCVCVYFDGFLDVRLNPRYRFPETAIIIMDQKSFTRILKKKRDELSVYPVTLDQQAKMMASGDS